MTDLAAVDPVAVAALLDAAHRDRRTIDVSTVAVGGLASAYAVQSELTSLRLSRGDEVVGWKLGYTTRAMREQMGIDAPNRGPLLASMRLEPGAAVRGIHPRVEPEIAFVMGGDPGPRASADDVLASIAEVRLALEIVDSVWTGYRFDLEHNTADGSSAHGFVLGPLLPTGTAVVDVELRAWPHDLAETAPAESTDAPIGRARGRGDVVDAAAAVAWLCRELAGSGRAVRAGDVILSGGLTAAAPLEAGAEAEALGTGAVVQVGASA